MVLPPTWARDAADFVRYVSLRPWQPRRALDASNEPLSQRVSRLKAAWQHARVSDGKRAADFNLCIFQAAFHRSKLKQLPREDVVEALLELGLELAIQNDNIFDFPDIDFSRSLTAYEARHLTDQLVEVQTRLEHDERIQGLFCDGLCDLYTGLLNTLPKAAFDGDSAPFLVPLHALVDAPELVGELVRAFLHDLAPEGPDPVAALAFQGTRLRLWDNLLNASRLAPEQFEKAPHKIVGPKHCGLPAHDMIEAYLGGTPLATLPSLHLPFSLPQRTRFEHCHIVGGSGHGKTQLLQLLIHRDLQRTHNDRSSIVVIDSQGDLIRTIAHLRDFSPAIKDSLADRFMLIDPNDIAYPVALNMFDVNLERIKSFPALEREKILNGTVELYEYIFGALLGAELTQKQGLIFRYLARLMMVIPDATIHTLRELLQDGARFKPHFQKLDGSARHFFETEFLSPQFQATKHQALRRLWGVLSNPTFERMFSHKRNKVDLFEAMNSGKIILINTAKDLLKQEGCEIFGRFFIAMITQAAIQRAAIPEDERRPAFVYIDEAHDYFDDNIEQLLNQARKYKVGLTLAHQNLNQLSNGLRASIMTSTSIKLVGGLSAKDATALAQDMRTTPEFLHTIRKHDRHTEFACYIKNETRQAFPISVPLGFVDELTTMDADDYEVLLDRNRGAYSDPVADPLPQGEPAVEPAPETDRCESEPLPARFEPEREADAPPVESTAHRQIQQRLKSMLFRQQRALHVRRQNGIHAKVVKVTTMHCCSACGGIRAGLAACRVYAWVQAKSPLGV